MKKVSLFLIALILFVLTPATNVLAINNPLDVANNIYGIGIINLSDLDNAAKLINSTNGDWGYVTVVITKEQRDKDTWQNFFDSARKRHVIPIIRIATKFDGTNWEIPDTDDIDNWVTFFNSLNWVIENRYVIIGNEPNHSKEWGGRINPEEYALYLKNFSEKLKSSNEDYFVLSAGIDQSANNSKITMDEKVFIQRMVKSIPNIFDYIDGWNSHSYPNPAFSGSEKASGRKSIKGYFWELDLIKDLGFKKELPVFITETGWVRTSSNDEIITNKFKFAFESVWRSDPQIAAVTPFILNYSHYPFAEFSWQKEDGIFYNAYEEIKNIKKEYGQPIQKIEGKVIVNFLNIFTTPNFTRSGYFLTKNTGQNIWDDSNIKINDEGVYKKQVVRTNNPFIEPFKTGLVTYTIILPEESGTYNLNLGLFVKDKKIDDIFEGDIVSIQPSKIPVNIFTKFLNKFIK